uniref:Uncharacterized protein n=1 Tax=Triticum urartu TaxID=4572 RepID=A0A8R7TGJ1_TRIUA
MNLYIALSGCASTTQKSAILQRKMSTSVITQKDHKFGGRKRSLALLVHTGRQRKKIVSSFCSGCSRICQCSGGK